MKPNDPCLPSDQIQLFLDGRLSGPERAALERHLGECRVCAGRVSHQRSLWEELERLDTPAAQDQPPSRQVESLMARVRREAPAPAPVAGSRAWWAWFPALAMVFLLFLSVSSGRKPPLPAPGPVAPPPLADQEYHFLSFAPRGEALRCVEHPTANLGGQGRLEPGKTYLVPGMGKTVVHHGSGRQLEFAAHSRFQVEARRVQLEAGKVLCQIQPGLGEFVVNTPYGRVHVVGTRFGVEVTAVGTLVTLFEGRILLKTPAKEQVVGTPETLILSPSGEIRKPAAAAPPQVRPAEASAPVAPGTPASGNPSAESINQSF